MQTYGSILSILNKVLNDYGTPRAECIVYKMSERIARADYLDYQKQLSIRIQQNFPRILPIDIETGGLNSYKAPSWVKEEVKMASEEQKNAKSSNPAVVMVQEKVNYLEHILALQKEDFERVQKFFKEKEAIVARTDTELLAFKKALKKIS